MLSLPNTNTAGYKQGLCKSRLLLHTVRWRTVPTNDGRLLTPGSHLRTLNVGCPRAVYVGVNQALLERAKDRQPPYFKPVLCLETWNVIQSCA